MFTFFSNKKGEMEKGYSVSQIPIFASMTVSSRKFIERKVRLMEFKKGDVVYEAGKEADAFYVVFSGRLRMFKPAANGREAETIAYLYRGDYCGEIALLTDRPHSISTEAVNNCLLLQLTKADFQDLVEKDPAVSLHLSRSLGLRLRDDAKSQTKEVKIASICHLHPEIGMTTFATNLAASIHRESGKNVFYVDMSLDGKGSQRLATSDEPITPLKLGEVTLNGDGDLENYIYDSHWGVKVLRLECVATGESAEKQLAGFMAYLVSQESFVLIDLPQDMNDVVLSVLAQSDEIYILTGVSNEDYEQCRVVIRELKQNFTFSDNQIKLLLSETSGERRRSLKDIDRLIGHRVFSVLPYSSQISQNPIAKDGKAHPYVLVAPRSAYSRTVRYLARELSGNLVGLALSSGAAHGLAHIGVIKVLEENNIPIDIVSGSSMGALVGALWASGYSSQQLEDLALGFNKKDSFFNILGLTDFSMPHHGFFKGHSVTRYLRTLFKDKTFRELQIPLKVIATNVFTSEAVVFEEGDVVDALRASISIPGIFRPVVVNGKTLTDGGIADPLPVNVLTRKGVKRIIAVNVLSGPEDIMKRRDYYRRLLAERALKARRKKGIWGWWHRLRVNMSRRYSANVFNVIVNSIQYMEYSLAAHASREADVNIHPIVTDAHWIEFYSGKKFLDAGEEEARKKVEEIKALVR